MRVQDDAQSGIFSLVENGNARDLLVSWGDDDDSKFKLEFINNLYGAVPNRNVMTALSNGNVGLGTDAPNHRLHLLNESTASSSTALVIDNQKSNGSGAEITADMIGLNVEGNPNSTNFLQYGVYSRSNRPNSQGSNFGLYGQSIGSGICFGIRGDASSTTGSAFGVFGYSPTTSPGYAGYFAGNLAYTGALTQLSDKRLKEDIQPEEDALEKILQLRPTTYAYRQEGELSLLNLAQGLQHGFIAQELERIFPEAVHNNAHVLNHSPQSPEDMVEGKITPVKTAEFKSVNYVALIPVLTKGIQEQQAQIEEALSISEQQAQTIEALKAQIEELQQSLGFDQEKAALGQLETAHQLYANAPNPFNQETQIRYEIAEGVSQAEILVFDMSGRQFQSHVLQTGSHSLTLSAKGLEPGMYFYSLVVEGKEIDTKRMILTK